MAMQSALGVQDLGRLHCSTVSDSKGVTIFVTVQHVADVKSVQVMLNELLCQLKTYYISFVRVLLSNGCQLINFIKSN